MTPVKCSIASPKFAPSVTGELANNYWTKGESVPISEPPTSSYRALYLLVVPAGMRVTIVRVGIGACSHTDRGSGCSLPREGVGV